MSLLHGDDLDKTREYVWVEQTIRFLVPKVLRSTRAMSQASIHEDVLRSSQVGSAGICSRCGHVTIVTTDYPWGEEKYKATTYCPHCSGEDVG